MNQQNNKPRLPLGFTLVEIMIVILIIGILLAIALPSFYAAREASRAKACVDNLVHLSSATEQYALDNKLASSASLNPTQFYMLAPTYIRTFPVCPAGGGYSAGATINSNPTCSISGSANYPSPTGVGDYAPPTAPGSLAGAGIYYHGLP